ncbi:serine/threonine-protein kinase 36 [Biomphalaria glabrata]|nr:serine/threonine-protein kinase 36-like [Biomphalaria glabrata]KAI8739224.1 serine/threonine-protein kinase 36 [Biomphalaria glabrata]
MGKIFNENEKPPAYFKENEKPPAYFKENEKPPAYFKENEKPPAYFKENEKPPAYFKENEKPPAYFKENEKPPAYFKENEKPPAYFKENEKPPAYFKENEKPPAYFKENEKPPAYFKENEKPPAYFKENEKPPAYFKENEKPPAYFKENEKPPAYFKENEKPPAYFKENEKPPAYFKENEKPPAYFKENEKPPAYFKENEKPPAYFKENEKPPAYFKENGKHPIHRQLHSYSDSPVASLYIESGIWDAMWHRIAQGVQVINVEMESPMLVGKGDSSDVPENFMLPDWSLISPQGLMASLQMAVTVFTKETYQCLPNLATSDSILMLTLVHFLHPGFLQGIHQHFKGDGPQLVEDIILAVTQMGCFPFAVDTSDELLAEIQHCLYTSKLVPRLLGACVQYLSGPPLETPIGLLSRLVLGNVIFVEQLATAIKTYKAVPFLNKCLSTTASVSVICDIISMCSHLVRVSPEHLDLVKNIFTGSDGDYLLLSVFLTHNKSAIKSRTCSLLGNIMRHNDQMYSVIKHKDKILDHLLSCLRDSDSNVRKCAAYAVGNACYHSGELYPKLRPAVPHLVDLLHDPITKTRANAASACGNLGMHSSVLFNDIKKCKLVAHLLEAACHDAQTIVQINAMLALRSLCQQQEILKDLLSLNGVDKLTPLLSTYTPRDVVTPRPITPGSRPGSVLSPRPTTAAASGVSVCAGKLLRLLQKGTA